MWIRLYAESQNTQNLMLKYEEVRPHETQSPSEPHHQPKLTQTHSVPLNCSCY